MELESSVYEKILTLVATAKARITVPISELEDGHSNKVSRIRRSSGSDLCLLL